METTMSETGSRQHHPVPSSSYGARKVTKPFRLEDTVADINLQQIHKHQMDLWNEELDMLLSKPAEVKDVEA